MKRMMWALVAACLISACGGGGNSDDPGTPPSNTTPPPPPPPPPASGIGAAGGVVSGPAGSQVTVPAGALSQNTAIAIQQSSAGSAQMPEDLMAVGEIFAFTPHGTSFSSPATVKVPFDPSRLPAGAIPSLYKTDATGSQWEVVAGATADGSTMTGQVSSFSYFVVAILPVTRSFQFIRHTSDDQEITDVHDVHTGGVLSKQATFGSLTIAPEDRDLVAKGELYSSASGNTYWVEAEAPVGNVLKPGDIVGGETLLNQIQFFRKNEAGATLRLKITEAWIDAMDMNGPLPRFTECPWAQGTGPADVCKDEVFGEVDLRIAAIVLNLPPRPNPDPGLDWPDRNDLIEAHQGALRVWGWQENWFGKVHTDATYTHEYIGETHVIEIHDVIPIFREDHFEQIVSDQNGFSESRVTVRLRKPVPVDIDLSKIPIGTEFYVQATANALAHNRRGYELSYVGARLRDPVQAGGLEVETTGLTAILPIDLTDVINQDEPECAPGGATGDSGTLQFSESTYGLAEFRHASGSVLVTRTGGSEGTVIAEVTTEGGTAIPGAHYTPVTRRVVFRDGDTTPRAIKIPIVNDKVFSGAPTIGLTIAPVANCANIGDESTAIATILDDDAPPPATYTVGGSVSGLAGTGLVLEEITSGTRVTPAANGAFAFGYEYPDASSYEVRIATQPINPLQICSVSNGSGVIASSSVTNISVNCTTPSSGGSLDSQFGSAGKVTTGVAGGATAIALQADGKVLALGSRGLARYNSDGTVDSSFGTAGEIAIAFEGGVNEEALALAVQPDGRILVAGTAQNGRTVTNRFNYDFAVARFNTDGSADTTFGTDGKVYTNFGPNSALSTDKAHALLLQPDGSIIAAGFADGVANDFALARYTSSGALDATFGNGGTVMLDIAGADFAYAAALQADGSIVMAGRVAVDGAASPDVGVVRFLSNGTLDPGFGTNGTVRIDYAGNGGWDEAADVALQADGKVVIAGHVSTSATDFLLARLNADGSRDSTFGSQGLVTADFEGQDDFARAVALQPDGRIVVVGNAPTSTSQDFGIARFLSDGAPDSTFGTDGRLTVDFFGAGDNARDLAVQADSKIVVGGSARNGASAGIGLIRIAP